MYTAKQAAEEAGSQLDSSDHKHAPSLCQDTIKWIDGNTLAEKDEYDDGQRIGPTVQEVI